ncbi:MAG: YibE/F family protein [Anaerolineales bacterium]|jgi:uncharacterized membrane protein
MKRSWLLFIPLALISIALGVWLGLWLAQPASDEQPDELGVAQLAEAEVVHLIEEGTVDLGGRVQRYQVVEVNVLDGPFQGQHFEVEYGRYNQVPEEIRLEVGDRLLVSLSQGPDGYQTAFFTDFVRDQPLLILVGTFVVFILFVSRWKGLRSLVGMAISFAIILYYILPQILAGRDPVWVSIIGSTVLLGSTIYLVYGWRLKSHASVLGILASLIVTGLLASTFVVSTRLTGFGMEETAFLIQFMGQSLDVRGLLLGGIIIGALGVLDDLVISQVSAVFELYNADPNQSWRQLYSRAMVIGQDHVAATVNTLVLAYVGAALPLMLLFILQNEPFGHVINRSFVVEEVVRTLVGSLGLMAGVPISTAIACTLVLNRSRLGGWGRWLGADRIEDQGGHHHHHGA